MQNTPLLYQEIVGMRQCKKKINSWFTYLLISWDIGLNYLLDNQAMKKYITKKNYLTTFLLLCACLSPVVTYNSTLCWINQLSIFAYNTTLFIAHTAGELKCRKKNLTFPRFK